MYICTDKKRTTMYNHHLDFPLYTADFCHHYSFLHEHLLHMLQFHQIPILTTNDNKTCITL